MSAAFHLAEELDLRLTSDLFRRAFPERSAGTFVLDGGGASSNPRLDRYAFMGAEPTASFRAVRLRSERGRLPGEGAVVRDDRGRALARVVITASGERETHDGVDPFEALRTFLAEHATPAGTFDPGFPFPLRAGLVGYVGYEAGQFIERLPCLPRPPSSMPDVAFSLHRWVLATSRATGRTWLSVLGRGRAPADARRDAERARDRVLTALLRAARDDGACGATRAEGGSPPDLDGAAAPPRAVLDRAEYLERVALAKAHIEAGDAFEICLTNALHAPLSREDAWALYDALKRDNPAPFAAMLDLPEGAIVSSSPERFLSLDARGLAESRPIKGTRPRGASDDEDAALARALAASDKDRAENAMIVDLVRSDLGKVCAFGTVEVSELFVVEPYATVHQLVSTVRGRLAPDRDAVDLLRACFPPGSMTGAPKIEAMSILERLEPASRGVYSGALGWIDLGGAMDLSVVIRTIVVDGAGATFSVGGAIVTDSDPAAEHDEAEHKARALVRALSVVSRRPSPREERR